MTEGYYVKFDEMVAKWFKYVLNFNPVIASRELDVH